MLHGRVAECAALARLLDEARASHSGVLVLRGEPGLGKSALLDEAMERAIGFRVLRAVAVESEAQLAFAGRLDAAPAAGGRVHARTAPSAQAGARAQAHRSRHPAHLGSGQEATR